MVTPSVCFPPGAVLPCTRSGDPVTSPEYELPITIPCPNPACATRQAKLFGLRNALARDSVVVRCHGCGTTATGQWATVKEGDEFDFKGMKVPMTRELPNIVKGITLTDVVIPG